MIDRKDANSTSDRKRECFPGRIRRSVDWLLKFYTGSYTFHSTLLQIITDLGKLFGELKIRRLSELDQ